MHCRACAERYKLPTESEMILTRCKICGEQRGCYSEKVADVKLLIEPREAIRKRILSINTKLDKLRPFVDKFNELYTEKTRLRDEHLRLEHLLTTIPVTKVRISAPEVTRAPAKTAKQVLKQLTKEEKGLLIALLEEEAKL
jgi:hypothetical protein